MKNSSNRKAGVVTAAAFGMILASGIVGIPLIGAEDMPEGFKKGDLAPEPSAEMIEAGKRVYFTKCVWCHGVDGAGDGPGADRGRRRYRNARERARGAPPGAPPHLTLHTTERSHEPPGS